MSGTSNLIKLVLVFGDKKPYLQVDRVEGLPPSHQSMGSNLTHGTASPASRKCPDVSCSELFPTLVVAAREMRDPWTS